MQFEYTNQTGVLDYQKYIIHLFVIEQQQEYHDVYVVWTAQINIVDLRNRSALSVNCCVIIHCLEVICKEDQITSAQRE